MKKGGTRQIKNQILERDKRPEEEIEMDGEIQSLIKVWITVIASLTYCYFISKNIPKGFIRFLSILPIISIFTYLPLTLHSIHLGGTTGFFIAWLSNFKLLLFSFDLGPLISSDPPSSISLLKFISLSCLPIKIKPKIITNHSSSEIKIKQNPSLKSYQNSSHLIEQNPSTSKPKSPTNYAIKGLLVAVLVRVYDYKQFLHPNFILFLYCFHIYFVLEIILALGATLARFLLGLELEPQFNDPYLSTSLQDFWGKRWNLMVTGILRPTVYEPVRCICTRILGRRWALLLGLLATFAVSGLMHELMFFYLGREWPTWEVMWFFALHGICLAVEISVKKALNGRWRLHPVVSGPLTVVFVMVTGFWLFFPQLVRCGADVRAIREYAVVGEYGKNFVRPIWDSFGRFVDVLTF